MPAARRLAIAVLVTVVAGLPALSGTATAQTTGADVSVAKDDSPDPVTVDTDLTYTITVRNDGPLVAPGVVVSDALVLTVDYVSATPSQGSCGEAALLVTCNLGNLANGATATVTLVVRQNAWGSRVNAVSAAPTPSSLDPDSSDNVAVESTTVVGPGGGPGADVAISRPTPRTRSLREPP
jgi:uncharacterized repeat protein (TIGR01451 family)